MCELAIERYGRREIRSSDALDLTRLAVRLHDGAEHRTAFRRS